MTWPRSFQLPNNWKWWSYVMLHWNILNTTLHYHQRHCGTMQLTQQKIQPILDEQCIATVFLCLFEVPKYHVFFSEGCLIVPLSFQQQKPLLVTRGCLRSSRREGPKYSESRFFKWFEGMWYLSAQWKSLMHRKTTWWISITLHDLGEKIHGAPIHRSVSSSSLA